MSDLFFVLSWEQSLWKQSCWGTCLHRVPLKLSWVSLYRFLKSNVLSCQEQIFECAEDFLCGTMLDFLFTVMLQDSCLTFLASPSWASLHCVLGWSGAHCVVHVGLELRAFLPPKSWGYRHVLPRPAKMLALDGSLRKRFFPFEM